MPFPLQFVPLFLSFRSVWCGICTRHTLVWYGQWSISKIANVAMRPPKDPSKTLDSSADVSIQIQRFDLVHSPETKRDKKRQRSRWSRWSGCGSCRVMCFWIADQVLYTRGVDTSSNAARPRCFSKLFSGLEPYFRPLVKMCFSWRDKY